MGAEEDVLRSVSVRWRNIDAADSDIADEERGCLVWFGLGWFGGWCRLVFACVCLVFEVER
jgi:hypothetical protein